MRKKIQWTPALRFYICKFLFRLALVLGIFGLYLYDRDLPSRLMNQPIREGINIVHVAWAVFMGLMILHLIPNQWLSMAWKKAGKEKFDMDGEFDERELWHYVKDQNVRAWVVLLVWLSFNALFGILYLAGILRESDLLMLTVFYFLCDYICILFFCPFQTFIMKNKCCINCRIYDWGHFMMFTPMLFIRNFYSWSLFFTSIVVLIHWEIRYARYPERFWERSNKTIRCANCKERTCQIKKKLAHKA